MLSLLRRRWAAALRHLPALLAIPVGLATTSCLLAPVVWLAFFANFPRTRLSQQSQWALVLVPLVIFGLPIVASLIAMIYTPLLLARPWPLVLSAAPVRLIEATAGVAPLLFLNVLPLYQPITQIILPELWLTFAILYLATGFLMLIANYRRLDDLRERRRVGALCSASVIFAIIIVHNVFLRNWTRWFGSGPSALFSVTMVVGEDVLFLLVPLTLAYCVLTEDRGPRGTKAQSAATKSPV